MKETEGPLKNGKGNLLTQVVRALFKGKKMKLILRLNVQRGEGTDARKRHKFPRGEREVLKEIKIILVLVIKKVECRGKKICKNKLVVSRNARERGRNTADT